MTLQRKSDGERLAMAEIHISYLQKGDQELKEQIQIVKEELEAKVDILGEKMDMVIAGLEANKNQIQGASKLAVIMMKAWPIAAAAIGAIIAWEQVK